MTKKATKVIKKEEPKQYVFLVRVAYKAMIPAEREIIEPAADPWAEDAPRRTMEHLTQTDINKLVMRRIIAEDK